MSLTKPQQKVVDFVTSGPRTLSALKNNKGLDARDVNNLLKSGVLVLDGEDVQVQQFMCPECHSDAEPGERCCGHDVVVRNVPHIECKVVSDGPGAKKAEKKAPRAKKAKELRPCLCGCGQMVPGLFAMGHDGRLRGMVVGAFRGNHGKTYPQTEATMQYLKSAHWMTKEIWAFVSK